MCGVTAVREQHLLFCSFCSLAAAAGFLSSRCLPSFTTQLQNTADTVFNTVLNEEIFLHLLYTRFPNKKCPSHEKTKCSLVRRETINVFSFSIISIYSSQSKMMYPCRCPISNHSFLCALSLLVCIPDRGAPAAPGGHRGSSVHLHLWWATNDTELPHAAGRMERQRRSARPLNWRLNYKQAGGLKIKQSGAPLPCAAPPPPQPLPLMPAGRQSHLWFLQHLVGVHEAPPALLICQIFTASSV